VREVARELDARLSRARLRAIRFDGHSRDAVLFFRELTLVWRLHPQRGAPTLHAPLEPGRDAFPIASRVRRVYAPTDERLVVIELLPVRGLRKATDVVVELLGNQWNCLVTEGEDRILRHVLHTRVGKRTLRVGQAYERPVATPREGLDGVLTRARWDEVVLAGPEEDRPQALVSRIAWTSTLNAAALLPAPSAEESHELGVGYSEWTRFASPTSETQPVLLSLSRGSQPYPWPLINVSQEPISSLLEGFASLDEVALGQEAESRDALIDPALLRRVERELDLAERRVTSLLAELEGLEAPEHLRAVGDLILARYREVPSGASEATLEDFNGNPVVVDLDAGAPPHANAARYYERAAKSERAQRRLPELIARAQAFAAGLRDLMTKARDGQSTREDIESALPERARVTSQSGPDVVLPFRRYKSSGGLEIRVGRGAGHNDDLTFRHSAPHDIWLHARHSAGAHVILRWPGPGNPPARDLEEAAILAALHSKARTSGSAPVDWTRRKYVRKPRGAPPGSVVPERVATLFVVPDPEVADALLQD